MGLAPLLFWLACLTVIRNQRILAAWNARQDANARRAAAGLRPGPAAGAAKPLPASPLPPRRPNRSGPVLRPSAAGAARTMARRAQPAAPGQPYQPGNQPRT